MKFFCLFSKEDNPMELCCDIKKRISDQKTRKLHMKKFVMAHQDLAVAHANYVNSLRRIGCALFRFTKGEAHLQGVMQPPPLPTTSATYGQCSISRNSSDLVEIMAKIHEGFMAAADSGEDVSVLLGWPFSVKKNGFSGKKLLGRHCILNYSTAEKIYDLEKKLYQQMKAEKTNQSEYEKRLREFRQKKGAIGDVCNIKMEKSRMAVVMMEKGIETTFLEIQRLMDKNLYFELLKHLDGVMCMWGRMHDCHYEQAQQIQIVHHQLLASSNRQQLPTSEIHRKLTLQLEREIKQWLSCFSTLMACQRVYISSLTKWLDVSESLKTLIKKDKIYSLCKDWGHAFSMISDKDVRKGINCLLIAIHSIAIQQQKEQEQNKRCGSVLKKLEKKRRELRRAGYTLAALQKHNTSASSSGFEIIKCLVEKKRAQVAALMAKANDEKTKQEELVNLTRTITVQSLLQLDIPQHIEAVLGFAGKCRDAFQSVYTQANGREPTAFWNQFQACDLSLPPLKDISVLPTSLKRTRFFQSPVAYSESIQTVINQAQVHPSWQQQLSHSTIMTLTDFT